MKKKQTAATAQVEVNWREEGSKAAAAIKTMRRRRNRN